MSLTVILSVEDNKDFGDCSGGVSAAGDTALVVAGVLSHEPPSSPSLTTQQDLPPPFLPLQSSTPPSARAAVSARKGRKRGANEELTSDTLPARPAKAIRAPTA